MTVLDNCNDPIAPSSPDPPTSLRLFLFSHPRTASNLFLKLYSEHPDLQQYTYPFLFPHFSGPDAQVVKDKPAPLTEAEKNELELMKHATYQNQLDEMEYEVAKAEAAGKIPLVKEHCCYLTQQMVVKEHLERPRGVPAKPKMEDRMLDLPEDQRTSLSGSSYHDFDAPVMNTTVLPDRLLKTFTPVFIIRHPAKQVGSFHRAASKARGLAPVDSSEFEMATTYRFPRLIFEYFRNLYLEEKATPEARHRSPWPIVVDGDDLINDTEGVSERFCALTGLDPAGVIYNWGKTESPTPIKAIFYGTLNASSGVVKNDYPERPSIFKEARKWEAEWGPDVASLLTQHAQKAMVDYEYLYQFRV